MVSIVDVFQAWCGPCKPVVNLFQKIKNEVGSDLLHFAVAEVDSVDALEKYRGQCEPVFLFYTVSENIFPVPSGSACCFCRSSLLSQSALLHPEIDEEAQSRLFQGFPLAVEQSSSGGGEDTYSVGDCAAVGNSRAQRTQPEPFLTDLLSTPSREEN
uniref:Thioredoxin domain-containing protein n=1 Tax=Geospiza parvula TaxID=87175 RepID=A0A8C3N7T5_GEOPR